MSPRQVSEGIAWRPAFALRVLTLTLLIGTRAREDPPSQWVFTAVLLAVVGLTAGLAHFRGSTRSIGVVPVFEALACVVLISASPGAYGLLGYLAVPPLAAGLTTGAIRCVSSGVVAWLALAGAALTPGVPFDQLNALVGGLWVSLGVLAGLIASWQTRAERALVARQDQALRTRHLLAQFQTTFQSPDALDYEAQARAALDHLILQTKAVSGKVVLTDGVQSRSLATTGHDPEARELARSCVEARGTVVKGDLLGVPLTGIQGAFGSAVLRAPTSWSMREVRAVEVLISELVIPLDSALLFAQVTDRATAAERSRLARDIHDTVAQDIASLGYVVDDLARSSTDPEVVGLAATLRAEITRIVRQLRYSIFDLHAGELSLAATITSHARQSVERSSLRLHLDVESVQLVEGQEHLATQLQRIAHEAVTNAVRHAHARHLWIRLHRIATATGVCLLLEVEDDGIGMGDIEEGSGFGVSSMRERAAAIGATLRHARGPAGGTVVTVELSDMPNEPGLGS